MGQSSRLNLRELTDKLEQSEASPHVTQHLKLIRSPTAPILQALLCLQKAQCLVTTQHQCLSKKIYRKAQLGLLK